MATFPKAIIMLGAPGSGKDTQAFALAKSFGYFVLVLGDIFRAEVQSGSAIGQEMQKYMDRGQLLPSSRVRQEVEQEMERHKSVIEANGLIFDGLPRLEEEINDTEELIDRYNLRPAKAILLSVPDEELLRRLALRGKKSGRADDTAKVAGQRIEIYHRESAPVIQYYRLAGNLVEIDANGPVEEVAERVRAALGGQ